ncbi:AAA family ATPase [Dialister micraerophilus]|uniref:Primase C terminal 2 (PriCT-2) n=1 Tax=Dialister micraerophilus UPII 345-E TaxID=910314 RepID=E4LA64_9FIRM|nr:AAA family ATPase [Dialister micraerophilus]EFR42353.1 primase C terminal 2 (PriCT-2) [Dialister micraerophilus UPII 345-E]
MSKIDLRPLLQYINPSILDYQEWLSVGMALNHEGYPYEVWETWSSRDSARFNDGECEKKYNTFRNNTNPLSGAYIVELAKRHGWKKNKETENKALDWNSIQEIGNLKQIVDLHYLDTGEVPEPRNWEPIDDIINYLNAVFYKHDIFSVVMTSQERQDGKYVPYGKGVYRLSVDKVINDLKRYRSKGYKPDDVIGMTFGDYDKNGGAWIRFNPLDGNGVTNNNVTEYRYTLVESDNMDTAKQKAIMEELELPIVAMVHSGNKSIHAIVKIGADTYEEYRKRVDYLYNVCTKNGLNVDKVDRNPSRLSRLAGVWRNGRKQFLIATNIGKSTYEEWKQWIEETSDTDLPPIENLTELFNEMPPLAPSLIEGVLRQGHKMLLSGSSKAGKSFALIELCIAIAEGEKWFDKFKCAKGKVMYVNLELDRASCIHRFYDVYKALGYTRFNTDNITIWNLRGKALPMDKLAPKLIRKAQKDNYIAIIIDPIYKVITGDENSADQMAKFCNQFDRVCSELGCAVIYCHHHSKGGQGMKRAIDRASGSGVFARDPDAILDMIQLKVKEDLDDVLNDTNAPKNTAWRITGTLREFATPPSVNVWFEYPIHKLDNGLLKFATEDGSLEDVREQGRMKGNLTKQAKKNTRINEIDSAYNDLSFGGTTEVTIENLANFFEVSLKTMRRDLNRKGNYKVVCGKVERIGK